MTVYVNWSHQGDTITVAELPSMVEAHRWIANQADHHRTHYYTSSRCTKEWREFQELSEVLLEIANK